MSSRDALSYAPRGLRRDDAARYIGISPAKFDHLVADGRMPKPVEIDGCRVWDRFALDLAFAALADTATPQPKSHNPFDGVRA